MQRHRRAFFMLTVITVIGIYSRGFCLEIQEQRNSFRFGYSQRMRAEMWDNTVGLSKESGSGSGYFRNRSSLSLSFFPISEIEMTLKLTNELRYYAVPELREFEFDEVFIDLLYFKWSNIFQKPFSITFGRQNMSLGEGFVIMDGGPLDGSRSAYFNAARLDWSVSEKSCLTAFYFYQPERDQYLPILNNLKKKLIEQHEEGFGVDYTASYASGEAQVYLIRKSARASSGNRSARIITPGIRINHSVCTALQIFAEGAYQLGDWNHCPINAYGGYLRAEYSPEKKWYLPKKVCLGGLYLSGDDQSTEAHEDWDPLFSRWPKWSESYIYALAPERGPAYWSNLVSLYAKLSIEITSDVILSVDYHHLMAPERASVISPFPGGSGKTRGDLLIGKLSYTLNDYLSGHVMLEYFTPGNFYFSGADSYAWIRFETFLNF